MRSGILLLVLLGLPAISLAVGCDPAITNCADCVDGTATSDCNRCVKGYFKETAKTCKACPDGTGRDAPSTTVSGTEANTVCTIKSAPQLKCAIAKTSYECLTCASGQYLESSFLHGLFSGSGCSTDCKSFPNIFGTVKLVPNAETAPNTTPASCNSCSSCRKCEYAPTLKVCEGTTSTCAVGYNKQVRKCTECIDGHYLKPHATEPNELPPTCTPCGANCKTCKDTTECTTCFPGWALDGTEKGNCLKAVATSGNIIKAALISILAVFIAW